MNKYSFTDEAVEDLNGIIDFTLTTWGQSQTANYSSELEQFCQKLTENPFLGQTCGELSPSLLSFPYRSHILYYRCSEHGISIIRILHSRMNVALYF